MTEFLIRHFIHDREHTEDPQVRTAYGTLAGVVGIVCNLFLFLIKFFSGLYVHSTAVIADAFNNLSDALSSVISLFTAKIVGRPSDESHPFGHGRVEYVATMFIAGIVIYIGIEFFRNSIGKILNPEPLSVQNSAAVLLLISVLLKLWLAVFNRTVGSRISNRVLKASAVDALFDAVITSVTILALLVYSFFGVNIDGIAGACVSLAVMYAGGGIAKDAFNALVGEAMDPMLIRKIEELVLKDPEVVGAHDLIIHNYGPNHYMASIHMEVSRTMELEKAHEIATRSEKKVLDELGVLLVVHIDPAETKDVRVLKLRTEVERILQILDPELSLHDFQVNFADGKTHITFDLAVPYSYSEEEERRRVQQVRDLVEEKNSEYCCEITADRGQIEKYEKI